MNNKKKTRNILLVEDDGDLRKVISEYLEELGFHVIVAARGKCAFRMFEKLPLDLALVDVSLPDMSGLEICKWVKNEKHLENVSIIIISGKCGLQDKLKGYLSGAERYLCKPFLLDDLAAEINALLKSSDDIPTGAGENIDSTFKGNLNERWK